MPPEHQRASWPERRGGRLPEGGRVAWHCSSGSSRYTIDHLVTDGTNRAGAGPGAGEALCPQGPACTCGGRRAGAGRHGARARPVWTRAGRQVCL